MNADPAATAIALFAVHSPWTLLAALGAGALTSVGPCAAPRMLAAGAFARGSGARNAWPKLLALACGLVAGSLCFTFAAGAALRALANARPVYFALAVVMIAIGIHTLWQGQASECAHSRTSRSVGGAFVLGASFPFLASPCCSPFLMFFAGAASGDWLASVGAACAFAVGHALPPVAAGLGASVCGDALRRANIEPAVQTVSGAVAVALGGYYGLLA